MTSAPAEDWRRILVGLDVEESGKGVGAGSRKAALQARALAEKTGAVLHFVHSTFRERHGADDPDAGPEPAPEVVTTLESFVTEMGAIGVRAHLSFTPDPAWVALIRGVHRGDGDAVMVSKRAGFASDGRRLGTVALKLLRKCPAPVWVVHPEYGLVYETVLAATDLTPVGDRAVRCAAWVSRIFGARLHVVHAYQIPFSVQLASSRESEEEHRAEIQRIESRAREHIRAALGTAEEDAELHVGCTSPSHAIAEAVRRLSPDLLVMGTLSRTGIAGLLVGNTAERILPELDCSLLTIKPDDFVSPVPRD